jgi:hypothetical protein
MNDFTHKYGKPDVHFDTSKTPIEVLASNRNLTDKHIEHLINSGSEKVHEQLIMNSSLTDKHVDDLFDKASDGAYSSEFYENSCINRDLKSHHIDQALEVDSNNLNRDLAHQKNATTKHLGKLITRGNGEDIAERKHPIQPSIITRLIKQQDYYINKKLSTNHLSSLNDEHKRMLWK